MKIIQSNQFESVFDLLTDQSTIFIVPSFQRPYSWEEKHVNDLLQDMEKASSLSRGHYLSTFQLIQIDPSELVDNDSVFLDLQDNHDLKELQSACVKDPKKCKYTIEDKFSRSVQLYVVVDGQQRLTSLFYLDTNTQIFAIHMFSVIFI